MESTNHSVGRIRRFYLRRIKKHISLLTLFLVWIAFCLIDNNYFSWTNFFNIGKQSAVLVVAGIGETLVILAGSIDLSVGSLLGLSAVLTCGASGVLGPFSLLVGPVIGLVAGLISGVTFTKGKIPSFMVTLAMLTILRGIVLIYTRGKPIWIEDSILASIAEADVFSIPLIIIIAILIFGIMYLVDEHTPLGRQIRAIGGAEKVARLSGIKIERTYILIFAIAGALVGFAGVMQASRTAAGIATTGTGFELDVIAAVVLGGTTLSGGIGGVVGTLIGALTMTSLSAGLNIVGITPYVQYVLKGLILMGAVLISIDRSKISSTK